jgi:two-component system chemotaxis response regulator CheY
MTPRVAPRRAGSAGPRTEPPGGGLHSPRAGDKIKVETMSKRILLVDDALFMRTTLRKILEGAQYEIAGEAENGQDAVEKYRSLKPDLVLMDITMPVMDGLEAARTIRSEDPNATIVMCTALGQQNLVVEALKAGARDYIVKPFEPSRVLEGVGKALAA